MSIKFIDSFDHYTLSVEKWDVVAITGGVSANVVGFGRFTPGALHLTGLTETSAGNGSITKTFNGGSEEGVFGFAFFFTENPSDIRVFFLDNGGAVQGGISFQGDDILLRDKDQSTVQSLLGATTVNVWQFVECRVKSHATLGEIEVHVNGALAGSITGIDTRGGFVDKIFISHIAEIDDSYMDDLYVLDSTGPAPYNTFLGDTRVTVLRPKANGNTNNFTPTGAVINFDAVDETLHDSDTTFVEAGQLGAKEDYNNFDFADLGISPGTIYAVQTVNATKKTDAGQLRYLDQMVIGGTTYSNAEEVIATSGNYKMTTYIRDTDPSDDVAWTEDKVAAVGSGLEITFREV